MTTTDTALTTTEGSNGVALTTIEAETLVEHEATIERGLGSFLEVGAALVAICDAKLYRATHKTFPEYCRDRWGFGKSQAYRLIESQKVVESVSPIGDVMPANEAQARALGDVPEEDRQDVWRRAVETAPVNALGRPAVTASMIEEVAEHVEREREEAAEKARWDGLSDEEREAEERKRRLEEAEDRIRWGAAGGADEDEKDDRDEEIANDPRFARMVRRLRIRGEEIDPAAIAKEIYKDDLDSAQWEREWAEEQAKRETEKIEAEQAEERDQDARRAVTPKLIFEDAKETLRRRVSRALRCGIAYVFPDPVEPDDLPREECGGWPVSRLWVAAQILEDIANDLREHGAEVIDPAPVSNYWDEDVTYASEEAEFINWPEKPVAKRKAVPKTKATKETAASTWRTVKKKHAKKNTRRKSSPAPSANDASK